MSALQNIDLVPYFSTWLHIKTNKMAAELEALISENLGALKRHIRATQSFGIFLGEMDAKRGRGGGGQA